MESGVGTAICFALIVGLEMFAGIFSNIFILIYIFQDFLHYNSVSTRNKILVALCASSLCYTIMISVNLLLGWLWPPDRSSVSVVCILFVLTMYSISSCSWMTACLCFFYFIKILHFKSQLLVQLRLKMKTVTPRLILVAEMISVCGSLLNVQTFIPPLESGQNISVVNVSAGMANEESKYLNVIYIVNVVPFLIVMVTAVSTVASLTLYVRRMRRRLETAGNTTALHGAVRTMLGLICLYTTYYIVMFTILFSSFSSLSVENWICLIILFSFSPVQAAILIHGNPKLWRRMLRMAARLSCI